jgi:hypothetical protein
VGDGVAALDAGSVDRVDGADGRAAAIAGAEIRKRGGKALAGHMHNRMAALVRAQMEPTAEDSLAVMRALSKLGTAISQMMRMIATTRSNSMREKPCCLFIKCS